jgi:hypothetical protein
MTTSEQFRGFGHRAGSDAARGSLSPPSCKPSARPATSASSAGPSSRPARISRSSATAAAVSATCGSCQRARPKATPVSRALISRRSVLIA